MTTDPPPGVDPHDYELALRIITDALRDHIGAHGPINRRYSRNAARLVAHALAAHKDAGD